jgi:hypothetical protein
MKMVFYFPRFAVWFVIVIVVVIGFGRCQKPITTTITITTFAETAIFEAANRTV